MFVGCLSFRGITSKIQIFLLKTSGCKGLVCEIAVMLLCTQFQLNPLQCQMDVPNSNISNKVHTLLCPFLKILLMLGQVKKGGREKD